MPSIQNMLMKFTIKRSISHISGPKLDQNLFQMATVTNPEKNGLLIIGGYSKVAKI